MDQLLIRISSMNWKGSVGKTLLRLGGFCNTKGEKLDCNRVMTGEGGTVAQGV